ncbi:MAG: Hsp20/alpha crystallin family protein [SAR324 cluster bacterium]|nr:Hsp20/alpha crystallin family protein [SAR324 cluster bacterium]
MSDTELEQLLKRQEEQEEMLSKLQSRSFKIDGTDQTELSENAIYDLHQRDDELFLSLDVPGVMEESLHVELNDTELLIRGEHPTSEPENANCLQQNRPRGPFEYRFLLPGAASQIESYQDLGVLYLRIQLKSSE